MVFYYTSRGGYHIYMGRDKFENEKLIQWGWPEDVWFHVDDMSSAHVYLRLKEVRPRPRAGWNLAHLVYALWFVQGDTIDTIDPEALYDCCQLVKVLWRPRCFVCVTTHRDRLAWLLTLQANSIKGCKASSVKIVRTVQPTCRLPAAGIGQFSSPHVRQVYTMWENLQKRADMDTGTIGFHNNKEVRAAAARGSRPQTFTERVVWCRPAPVLHRGEEGQGMRQAAGAHKD